MTWVINEGDKLIFTSTPPPPPPQTHTYMVLKFIVVSNGLISYIAPRTIGFYHTLIIKIIKFRQN